MPEQRFGPPTQDLSLALVDHQPDEERESRLLRLRRLTPQERLQQMLERLEGGH
jgi:hypothetical protein